MKLNRLTPVVSSLVFAAASQFSGAATVYNLNSPGALGTTFTVDTGTTTYANVPGVVINGAYFTVDAALATASTAGTGTLNPFLSLQQQGNNTTEQAYNADVANYDSKSGGPPAERRNRDVLFSDLRTVTINGSSYFSFLIDVNEANNAEDGDISLDSLKIWSSATQKTTEAQLDALGGTAPIYSADTPVSSFITYQDFNSGSGRADILFYVPVKPFEDAGVKPTDYFYMYQQWGLNDPASIAGDFSSESTFEETKFGLGVGYVPEPGSMAGLMGLLAGGAFLRSRRRPTA